MHFFFENYACFNPRRFCTHTHTHVCMHTSNNGHIHIFFAIHACCNPQRLFFSVQKRTHMHDIHECTHIHSKQTWACSCFLQNICVFRSMRAPLLCHFRSKPYQHSPRVPAVSFVCVYVCMYVCMYVWIYTCFDPRGLLFYAIFVPSHINTCYMSLPYHTCMCVCVYVCMYLCMDICYQTLTT